MIMFAPLMRWESSFRTSLGICRTSFNGRNADEFLRSRDQNRNEEILFDIFPFLQGVDRFIQTDEPEQARFRQAR